jgi:hypothetical protein
MAMDRYQNESLLVALIMSFSILLPDNPAPTDQGPAHERSRSDTRVASRYGPYLRLTPSPGRTRRQILTRAVELYAGR